MALKDLIQLIKAKASINEVIRATEVGNFPVMNNGLYRRNHGIHEDSSRGDSCRVHGQQNWWNCFVCGHGGDVIAWVLHAKFGGDRSRYRDAVHWLADYYNISVSETPLNLPQYQTYELLTEVAWKFHANLLKNPDKLTWVQQKWGLDKETIEYLRLGYSEGLTQYGYDQVQLQTAGLVDSRGRQPLDHRIVFPYMRDGLVVWMSGRTPFDETGIPKYSNLQRTNYVRPTLYNFDSAYTMDAEDPIIFTEGLGDAARAQQEGMRVVASGGAQLFTPEMYDDAIRLLDVCKDLKYIIYDSDLSGAGLAGAKSLAQILVGFGTDPFIIELPRPENEKQVDLAAYLNTHGVEDLAGLMTEAVRPSDKTKNPRTLPNILMDELPINPDPERIKKVLASVAPLSQLIVGKYLDTLASITKTDKVSLRKEVDNIRKLQEKTKRTIAEDYCVLPFLAQDFVYHPDLDVWRAHTCLYVPYEEVVEIGSHKETSIVERPVHLCTDMGEGGVYSITKNEALIAPSDSVLEQLPDHSIASTPSNRWSVASRFSYSFTNFIDGKARSVDIGATYKALFEMIDTYVWLPEPRDKHIMTLYIMLSYVFMGFPACPYLHFRGKKDSGKSTCMDLMSTHSFNAVPAYTVSEAVLFRIAHSTRGCFFIDEAEQLRNPASGSQAENLLRLALGSYANNEQARAIRCNKNSLSPESFFTYSPKVFGSINELKDTLRSRSITIECASASSDDLKTLGDWDADKVYLNDRSQEIRDQLRIWALTQFRTLRETYDNIDRDRATFLKARDRQIWKPLLAIADIVTEASDLDVSEMLLENAKEKLQKSRVTEASMEFTNIVLIALYRIWQESPEKAGRYVRKRTHEECIIPAIATEAVILRLQADRIWIDNFNRLDTTFFIKQLRDIDAINSSVRGSRARINGQYREAYPFEFANLEAFIVNRELLDITELPDEDEEEDADDVVEE